MLNNVTSHGFSPLDKKKINLRNNFILIFFIKYLRKFMTSELSLKIYCKIIFINQFFLLNILQEINIKIFLKFKYFITSFYQTNSN
jgi:hypothetical protein